MPSSNVSSSEISFSEVSYSRESQKKKSETDDLRDEITDLHRKILELEVNSGLVSMSLNREL